MCRLFPAGSLWSRTSANLEATTRNILRLFIAWGLCFSRKLDETWTEPKFGNLCVLENLPTTSTMFSCCFLCSWVQLSLVQVWIRPRREAPALCIVLRTPKTFSIAWCSLTLLKSEGDTAGTPWHATQISAICTASQHLSCSQMSPH